eukprot:3885948-Amphidinium_carterae.2
MFAAAPSVVGHRELARGESPTWQDKLATSAHRMRSDTRSMPSHGREVIQNRISIQSLRLTQYSCKFIGKSNSSQLAHDIQRKRSDAG